MTNQTDGKTLRVGDLFVQAGILTAEVVNERLEVSKLLGQPLGQTLEQTGDVTRYQLVCAVQLQSLYLDGALPLDAAVEAIRKVAFNNCFLEDALQSMGLSHETMWTTRLGELLLRAGYINDQQLADALDLSFRKGVALGQVLLQIGLAEPATIAKALSLQRLIRSGSVSRDEATEELKNLRSVTRVEKD